MCTQIIFNSPTLVSKSPLGYLESQKLSHSKMSIVTTKAASVFGEEGSTNNRWEDHMAMLQRRSPTLCPRSWQNTWQVLSCHRGHKKSHYHAAREIQRRRFAVSIKRLQKEVPKVLRTQLGRWGAMTTKRIVHILAKRGMPRVTLPSSKPTPRSLRILARLPWHLPQGSTNQRSLWICRFLASRGSDPGRSTLL